MHTTAIEAMRLYCVYAGTLGASKKKKITVLLQKKWNLIFSKAIKESNSESKKD